MSKIFEDISVDQKQKKSYSCKTAGMISQMRPGMFFKFAESPFKMNFLRNIDANVSPISKIIDKKRPNPI